MTNLFLSYSRKDLPAVQQLEQALQAGGHNVWRDLESIRGGQQWPKAIGEGIAANDFFVLVWSQQAAQSHFVEFEWNTALALKKNIVPCLFDDTLLPPSLRAINGIHFQDFANGVSALLKSLQQSSPAVAPAQQAKVLAKLQTLKTDAPEKVVAEAKTIFAQQGWNVQGNIYQAAGDIHLTVAPPAEAPKKKLLERWQTWVGLIIGILTIAGWFLDLPEKIGKFSQPQSELVGQETATTYLRGMVTNFAEEPIAGVTITLEELSIDTVLTAITTGGGGFYFEKVPGKIGERARVYVNVPGYKGQNEYVALPGPVRFKLEEIK